MARGGGKFGQVRSAAWRPNRIRWELTSTRLPCYNTSRQVWASQRSLHNTPIFRLLLKVAVNGTHQCDSFNFCGSFGPQLTNNAAYARGPAPSPRTRREDWLHALARRRRARVIAETLRTRECAGTPRTRDRENAARGRAPRARRQSARCAARDPHARADDPRAGNFCARVRGARVLFSP